MTENSRISAAELLYIRSGVSDNVRSDGRSRTNWRQFELSFGTVPNANGSALVRVGSTEVLASVKVDIGEVWGSVRQGRLHVHVESTPAASSTYAAVLGCSKFNAARTLRGTVTLSLAKLLGGSFDLDALQQAQLAGDGLEERVDDDAEDTNEAGEEVEEVINSSAKQGGWERFGLDYASLYIDDGRCFTLYADVSIFSSSGGNVVAAASLAVKAALMNTKLPHVTLVKSPDGVQTVEVDDDASKAQPLRNADQIPVLVSTKVVSGYYVVDPSLEEDLALPHTVYVGVLRDGGVNYIDQGATHLRSSAQESYGIPLSDLPVLVAEAASVGLEMHQFIEQSWDE